MKIDSSLSSYMYSNFKDAYLNANRVAAQSTESEVSSTPPSTVVHISDRLKSYLSVNSTESSGVAQSAYDASKVKSNDEEVSSDMKALLAKIDADPVYAERCAKNQTMWPDVQWTTMDELMSLGPTESVFSQEENNIYSQTVDRALAQRRSIYNEMKSQGASGKDIYYAIMEYNNTLPESYKKQVGLTDICRAVSDNKRV